MVGPSNINSVWPLFSFPVLEFSYYSNWTQIHLFENTLLGVFTICILFSKLLFNIIMFLFFFGLRSASSCGGYVGIVLQSWRWSRSGLTVVTIGVVLQIWRWSHSGAASRWCVGFAISFAVVLGFADLRPISLSPNVARYGTDSSLSQWTFVGLWWPVVGFC
jgi:hypothetical protein